MKPAFPFGLCLFVVVAFATLIGCNRGALSDANSNRPSSSPAPVGISSSAEVVKITTPPVSIAAIGSANAVVNLLISPGFHINANPATFSYLIATEVVHSADPDEPLVTGKPVYPAGIKKKFAFAEQPLAVYEGDVAITLPLQLPSVNYLHPGKGAHLSLPITVKVQACDNEKCFPPATVNATIPVEVK